MNGQTRVALALAAALSKLHNKEKGVNATNRVYINSVLRQTKLKATTLEKQVMESTMKGFLRELA